MWNLDKMLKERGMKPADLARETGIPKSTIYKMVADKSIGKKYQKVIANYFGVTVDHLLGIKEKTAPAMTEHDRSVKMLMDLWGQLTPEERLELVAYGSELVRNRKVL